MTELQALELLELGNVINLELQAIAYILFVIVGGLVALGFFSFWRNMTK